MVVVVFYLIVVVHKVEKVVEKYLELDSSDFALIEVQTLREGQIADFQTNLKECSKGFNYFERDKGNWDYFLSDG